MKDRIRILPIERTVHDTDISLVEKMWHTTVVLEVEIEPGLAMRLTLPALYWLFCLYTSTVVQTTPESRFALHHLAPAKCGGSHESQDSTIGYNLRNQNQR